MSQGRGGCEVNKVNHPQHYNECGDRDADGSAKYEAIKVIEDWGLGFKLGNASKYICRAPHKGSDLEDIQKALWYVDRACKHPEYMGMQCGRRFTVGDVIDGWKLSKALASAIAYIAEGRPDLARCDLQKHIEVRR
jgi:hypothetical protein